VPSFDASEASIHYDQFGSGKDVVFVSGGGDTGARWHRYQIPHFSRRWRCTTFDNRGVGATRCSAPLPWSASDFARDTAELIEGVCQPPVALVGLSMGSIIVQQVTIDRPDLVSCAVVMGTGANSEGWCWDYQEAEIEFRRAGGRLDGMMGVVHYASMLYPARALGDPELWGRIKEDLLGWMESGDNEESLEPHWDMSLRFDQTAELPGCRIPLHVIAGQEDIQAPPQDAKVVADLVPGAELHVFEGMGHCSIYGHMHGSLNPFIESLISRHA
jgi:pimeloyl-ACP methyl ester carboxylesterase